MRIAPNSISGQRLRKHGVASQALEEARISPLPWQPFPAFTLPLPISVCIITIRRNLLVRDPHGDLADGPALAPLMHQLYHVHQRLEWGFLPYLGRHLWSRLVPKGLPVRRRHVEREAYNAVRSLEEYYALQAEAQESSSSLSELSADQAAGQRLVQGGSSDQRE